MLIRSRFGLAVRCVSLVLVVVLIFFAAVVVLPQFGDVKTVPSAARVSHQVPSNVKWEIAGVDLNCNC